MRTSILSSRMMIRNLMTNTWPIAGPPMRDRSSKLALNSSLAWIRRKRRSRPTKFSTCSKLRRTPTATKTMTMWFSTTLDTTIHSCASENSTSKVLHASMNRSLTCHSTRSSYPLPKKQRRTLDLASLRGRPSHGALIAKTTSLVSNCTMSS